MRHLLLLSVLAIGCDPYGHWPDGWQDIEGPLWSPDLVATSTGLYVELPHAHLLVQVAPDSGDVTAVDLGGADVRSMGITPDEGSVLVYSTWDVCEDDDPKIKTLSDCNDEDLSTSYALDVVRDGAITQTLDIPPHLNALAFNHAGDQAVAYLDYDSSEDIPVEGLLDLYSVAFVDLSSGDIASVSVGFQASNILFSDDDSKALVLSRSKAVVVDMASFAIQVEYPFTLDADQEVDPLAAALTPDGRYALVSIVGSTDLYKLDLEVESIDIISLDGRPSDMVVDATLDQTVLVYANKAQADILDHDYFDLTTIELDEPCTDILDGDGFAVLFNASSSYHDVYRLDLDTGDLTEYVVANPVTALRMTDSQGYAVAILRPESGSSGGLDGYQDDRYGLAVIDLSGDDAVSLTLESEPVGFELVESDGGAYALLLLSGVEDLLVVDLSNPTMAEFIALPEPPTGIGTMPDDRFYITHDAPLGLVSFLDPTDNSLSTIGGFASTSLFYEDALPPRGL